MKGISPIVSTVLMLGIYASLIFIAYNFGNQIIEKNADTVLLEKAEDFLSELKEKINEARATGCEREIKFDIPGEIVIDAKKDRITYSVKAAVSLYENNSCLSWNCNSSGVLGKDNFLFLRANSYKFENWFIDYYFLETRNLTHEKNIYRIDFITPGNVSLKVKRGSKLIIKAREAKIENFDGKKLVTIPIELTIG